MRVAFLVLAIIFLFSKYIKVNKSIYIAKSRQQYFKTLTNILLHVPNHALKDVYMLNYRIIKNTNSAYYSGLSLSRTRKGPTNLFEIEKVRDREN